MMPPVAVSKMTFVAFSLLKRLFESISVVPSCATETSSFASFLVRVYTSTSALPGML